MKLQTINQITSVLVVAVGTGQVLATPYLFSPLEEPSAWFAAGGLSLILIGMLSRLALRYGSLGPSLRTLSTVASVGAAAFWVLLATSVSYKFQRYPAAYGALAIICVHAACSVLAAIRGRTAQIARADTTPAN